MKLSAFSYICILAVLGGALAQTGIYSSVVLYARLHFTNQQQSWITRLDAECYDLYNTARDAYQFTMQPLLLSIANFRSSFENLDANANPDFRSHIEGTLLPVFDTLNAPPPGNYEEMFLMGVAQFLTYPSTGAGFTYCSYTLQNAFPGASYSIFTSAGPDGPLSDECQIHIINEYANVYEERAAEFVLRINEFTGGMASAVSSIDDDVRDIVEKLDDLATQMTICNGENDCLQTLYEGISNGNCGAECIDTLINTFTANFQSVLQQQASTLMNEFSMAAASTDYYTAFLATCP